MNPFLHRGAITLAFLSLIIISSSLMAQPTKILHTSNSRGHADHGWLETYHSFSFANWHNPERMHFGALRVLNDDHVTAGRGFGKHPHDNMEIISIPLSGDLRHEDSMGNVAVIREGDVQVMSAGTGIVHAEFNDSETEDVRFLQIWIFPNERDLQPRYDQKNFDSTSQPNKWQRIVQPIGDGGQGVEIHQNAWLHLGRWEEGEQFSYDLNANENGVYIFVLEGQAQVDGETLKQRDGMGISNVDKILFSTTKNSRLLLLEVPMQW